MRLRGRSGIYGGVLILSFIAFSTIIFPPVKISYQFPEANNIGESYSSWSNFWGYIRGISEWRTEFFDGLEWLNRNSCLKIVRSYPNESICKISLNFTSQDAGVYRFTVILHESVLDYVKRLSRFEYVLTFRSYELVFNWGDLMDKPLSFKHGVKNNHFWFRIISPPLPASFNYDLDPALIGRSTSAIPSGKSFQRKCFYSDGRYWASYSNGSYLLLKSSVSGLVSSWNTIVLGGGNRGEQFSIWFDDIYFYYVRVLGVFGQVNVPIKFRRGNPNSNGSISWSASEQTVINADPLSAFSNVYVSVDSDGYPYIVYEQRSASPPFAYDVLVTKSSLNNGVWSVALGYPLYIRSGNSNHFETSIVPFESNNMFLVSHNLNTEVFGVTIPSLRFTHQETTSISGTPYYLLKQIPSDSSGMNFSVDAGATKRRLFAKWVFPLTRILRIESSSWRVYYRTWSSVETVNWHMDIDIIIRKSDDSIRTTIASNVANSPTIVLTDSPITTSGTYSFSTYPVVDDSDYLEIDFYATIEFKTRDEFVYLNIDDNSVSLINQTRLFKCLLLEKATVNDPRDYSVVSHNSDLFLTYKDTSHDLFFVNRTLGGWGSDETVSITTDSYSSFSLSKYDDGNFSVFFSKIDTGKYRDVYIRKRVNGGWDSPQLLLNHENTLRGITSWFGEFKSNQLCFIYTWGDSMPYMIYHYIFEIILFSVTFYFHAGGSLLINGSSVSNGSSNNYGAGSILNLTAIPTDAYNFKNFTYDCSSTTDNPFYLTVSKNYTIHVYFDLLSHLLFIGFLIIVLIISFTLILSMEWRKDSKG